MESNLKRLIIGTIVGTFVLLVALIVVWNMVLLRPLKAKSTALADSYKAATDEAALLGKNLRAEKQAEDNAELVGGELSQFRGRYRTIDFDLSTPASRDKTWRGYMTEYSRGFGIALRQEIEGAVNDSGVTLASVGGASSSGNSPAPDKGADQGAKANAENAKFSFSTPLKFQRPEDVTAPGSLLKPTGGALSISIVAGSYDDAIKFLDRLNQGTILMTVGNIKLESYSPAIKVSLTITPYLMTRGPSVVLSAPAAAPAAGAGAAGAPGQAGAPPPAPAPK